MRLLGPFLAVIALCSLAPAAFAERRVALVVGNSAYEHADRLANPLTDARNMRDALRKIGFAEADIVYGEDLGKRDLERAIGRFADLARGADVALAFYAGHGATFGDTPYVVPIDARFDSIDQMRYELTPLEDMIGELRKAKGVRIAIIDACRDNSAERDLKRQDARGGEITRGLAPPKHPEGLILAYATQYLSTAADGPSGGDSPFTAALLKHLPRPGLDVKQLFFDVGADVLRTTGGRQRPEVKVSFFDAYTLVPGAPEASSADARQAEFDAAMSAGTVAALDGFLGKYSTGPLANTARRERERLSRPQLAAVTPAAPFVPRLSGPCGGMTLASLGSRSPSPLSANEECALAAKAEFQECENCPKMVVVPAGSFTMGSPKGEKGRGGDEGPQHDVTISRPFAVGKFEVSFEEWDACVAGGGCSGYRSDDRGWGRGRLPVINVSWNDAQAYASWLSKKTGKSYRLLSEAEWEYSARGGAATPFWWGTSISTDQANYDGTYTYNGGRNGVYRAKTVAVDSFAPNGFGLYNVHGNVWEWVEDCYHENYSGALADGSAWTAENCSYRVLRGGSWSYDPRVLRAAYRNRGSPANRTYDTGLRLARTLNH